MSLVSVLVTLMTVKHPCRWISDASVTHSVTQMLALDLGYQCWGHLWTFLKPLCSSLCSAEPLTGTGTLCSHLPAGIQAGQLCHEPGTSNAVPAWLPTLKSHQKRLFFFFNSCFQFSGDSDTAARIKWSSSSSELYSRRPWVSSLKESLVSPAINWIQFFNLTDGKRYSSSALYTC